MGLRAVADTCCCCVHARTPRSIGVNVVHTARRYYRLNGLVSFTDWSVVLVRQHFAPGSESNLII